MDGVVTFTKSRLGVRLLVFLIVGVILSFGILTSLIVRRERAILMGFIQERSSLLANSITSNLTEAMLEKDPAIVRRMLSRHSSIGGIQAAVFRSDGTPVYGSIEYDIPRDIVTSPRATSVWTKGHLIFLKPLSNERECQSCHGTQDRIRGIVAIRISTEKAEREVDSTARRVAAFAGFTALMSGIGLILIVRRIISEPLTILRKGTEKVRDGDLSHRIELQSEDELGSLASSFNQMTERVENAHRHLEDAVHRRTRELRVVAELSSRVFRGDLSLQGILDKFLASMSVDLHYSFCALCFIDKETGTLSQEYTRNMTKFCSSDIALTDNHPFVKAILDARTVTARAGDLNIGESTGFVVMIPVVSHRKRRCKETNLCTYTHCPAFSHPDERCWLVEGTLCRSPRSVRGKAKIYGCVRCDAFPLMGVLIAGSREEVGKSSIHTLEIMASEIAAAIENYNLMEGKKSDIRQLIRLADVSVESIQSLDMPELMLSIVSLAASFGGADASILWLAKDEKELCVQGCFGIDKESIPCSISSDVSFVGTAIKEARLVETVDVGNIECLRDLVERNAFLYSAFVPLIRENTLVGCLALFKTSDFFMTDTEKAIISLFASQTASAMATARLYQDLKYQKEFSDAIFNSTLSGVAVFDKDGTVIRINKAGLDILNLSGEDILGKKITDVYPETEEMLVFDRALDREMTIKFRHGGIKPVGFSNSPLLDKNGNEEGIIIVFRDLTEIKDLQVELRKKQHYNTMTKVISGVAHEVRNPLFAIQSLAQLLERDIESEQHQSLLSALLKETRRMKNLIDELLLYGRPAKLNVIDLDLRKLLEELGEYCETKKPRVDIMISVPPNTTIKADRDKLLQVFLNLLDNALAAGSNRITITSEKVGSSVRVFVRDNGAGVRGDDIEKIFDPFFTTKKDGTGLGLPICKKIIEDHGGSIEIRSAAGAGTTAILVLKTDLPY